MASRFERRTASDGASLAIGPWVSGEISSSCKSCVPAAAGSRSTTRRTTLGPLMLSSAPSRITSSALVAGLVPALDMANALLGGRDLSPSPPDTPAVGALVYSHQGALFTRLSGSASRTSGALPEARAIAACPQPSPARGTGLPGRCLAFSSGAQVAAPADRYIGRGNSIASRPPARPSVRRMRGESPPCT